MHRFYCEQLDARGRAALTPEDAHHAARVLRLRPGDPVELICQGARYRARMLENSLLEAGESLPTTEPELRITLFQGLPKGDKMDLIVQKAVEIGVARVVPVMMRRCVVKLSPGDGEKKQARWQKIAREAGKQSGRCLLPEVTRPIPFPEVAAAAQACGRLLVPWEEARAMGPRGFAESHPGLRSLGILIGPEGGIDPEEIAALPECQPLTLGPRILRTETAGLAAAAALLALYGEMETNELS